jgi:hypothetical protein
MQVGSNAPGYYSRAQLPAGRAWIAPTTGVSCLSSALHRVSVEPFTPDREPPAKEGVMKELNFSSNADWMVAVLLLVTVVAAFI